MTYQSYHDATTCSSLLGDLVDTDNAEAWTRFFKLYAGFAFAIARGKGLSSEDADDVVQVVFADLARKMPTFDYNRQKGRFRSYLLELINWRVIDKLKSYKREVDFWTAYVEESNESLSDGAENTFAVREWQSCALDEGLRRLETEVRPEHFAAFVESAVEGLDTETVMRLHRLSRDNLYQVRKRLTTRLKILVSEVLKEMDAGQLPCAGTGGSVL